MKYKTATRIAVKLIGIFLLATSTGSAGYVFGAVVEWVKDFLNQTGQNFYGPFALGQGIALLFQLCAGFYMLFRGEWLVNLIVPSNRPYCHECGYELSKLPSEGVCPECGTAYRKSAVESEVVTQRHEQ